MKIFDATAVIAFLWDLDFPEAFDLLSRRHTLILPSAVVGEVRREKARASLQRLLERGVVKVAEGAPAVVARLRDENPSLGLGECEAAAVARENPGSPNLYIICDDTRARARLSGVRYVWTEELIDYMRERGLIQEEQQTQCLEKLARSGFYSRVRPGNAGPKDIQSVR